ncbi:hypothetical protein evm_013787 [Chilo suppressalis]|nr:hypothetical protein evm_013787 [Chilo suppressalis]
MPKSIPFHIVYATSEDSSYPACELNSQGPATRGWRSAGAPPHELLLRLSCVTSVHKLQLLAHHQLIRTRGSRLGSAGAPPPELLLQLSFVTSVQKLQFLAHHQLMRKLI